MCVHECVGVPIRVSLVHAQLSVQTTSLILAETCLLMTMSAESRVGNQNEQAEVSHFTNVGGWGGGESVCDTPTGKSCFVFVFAFALRACVRDATRDQGVSRRVFVPLLLLLLRPPGPDTVKPTCFSLCDEPKILLSINLKVLLNVLLQVL